MQVQVDHRKVFPGRHKARHVRRTFQAAHGAGPVTIIVLPQRQFSRDTGQAHAVGVKNIGRAFIVARIAARGVIDHIGPVWPQYSHQLVKVGEVRFQFLHRDQIKCADDLGHVIQALAIAVVATAKRDDIPACDQ